MPASRPKPNSRSASRAGQTPAPITPIRPSEGKQADGTRQLLQWGASMLGAGGLAALLLQTVLGGFSPTGASTNTVPFGGLLLSLGVAKWLRNRALSRDR